MFQPLPSAPPLKALLVRATGIGKRTASLPARSTGLPVGSFSSEGGGVARGEEGRLAGREEILFPRPPSNLNNKEKKTMSNDPFNDAIGSYEAHQAAHQARMQEIKPFVLDQLLRSGVHIVTAQYDGEGDSGQINEITGYDANKQDVDLHSLKAEMPSDDSPLAALLGRLFGACSLRDLVETYTWEILGAYHGGFENDGGGFGTFTIDVEAGTISLEHNDRFVEVDTTMTAV
jgi:hypothetical protein